MKKELEHRPLVVNDIGHALVDSEYYKLGYTGFTYGDYKIYLLIPADRSRPCLCRFMPKKYPNEAVIIRRLNNTEIVMLDVPWKQMREAGGNPHEYNESAQPAKTAK